MVFNFMAGGKKSDVKPHVRKLIDLTTPNKPTPDEQRLGWRHNRTLPVLMYDWKDEQPVLDSASVGFTRDLSDHGIGLFATVEPVALQHVISICASETDVYHFVGSLREVRPFPLGIWIVGYELEGVISNEQWLPELNRRAEQSLLPMTAEPV